LKLAEEDDAVRRAIAQYLAEKAKNGTPRQRGTAEKILKRHLFSINSLAAFSTLLCVSWRRAGALSMADMWNCRTDDN
jgi:anti-sigma factor RsiW